MLSYCLKCRRNTESKNSEVISIKNERIMFLSKCSVCNSKKLKFLKEKETRGLLKNLTRVKIPILSDLPILNTLFWNYKMNAIVNNLSLTGDKFIPEMHLWQPGFTCSACGSFTKTNERIKKFKETGYSRYIYQNELDKLVFNMTWLMEILKI